MSIHRELTRLTLRRNAPAGFAWALGLAAVAVALRSGLIPYLSGYPFITLFPAVLVSAVIGGLWPGVVCIVLCLLGSWFFVIPPRYSFAIPTASDALGLLIFSIASALMVLVAQQLRGALRRLDREREGARRSGNGPTPRWSR